MWECFPSRGHTHPIFYHFKLFECWYVGVSENIWSRSLMMTYLYLSDWSVFILSIRLEGWNKNSITVYSPCNPVWQRYVTKSLNRKFRCFPFQKTSSLFDNLEAMASSSRAVAVTLDGGLIENIYFYSHRLLVQSSFSQTYLCDKSNFTNKIF